MDSDTRARRHAEQKRHEDAYNERREADRPRPTHEVWQLQALAQDAVKDPARLIEWSLAATPQTYLMALAAQRWDERHVCYDCIHCHDGKDLPQGYVCQVCDRDNPRPGSF